VGRLEPVPGGEAVVDRLTDREQQQRADERETGIVKSMPARRRRAASRLRERRGFRRAGVRRDSLRLMAKASPPAADGEAWSNVAQW